MKNRMEKGSRGIEIVEAPHSNDVHLFVSFVDINLKISGIVNSILEIKKATSKKKIIGFIL